MKAAAPRSARKAAGLELDAPLVAEESVADAESEAAEPEALVEVLLVADAPYELVADTAPAVPFPVSKKTPPIKAAEVATGGVAWDATCEAAWVEAEVVIDEATEEVVEETTDVLVAEVLEEAEEVEEVEVVEVVRTTEVV